MRNLLCLPRVIEGLVARARYRAPEILEAWGEMSETCEYTAAVDIWSWGCIVYECLSGELYVHAEDLSLSSVA